MRKLSILGLAALGLVLFLSLAQSQSTAPRFVTGLTSVAMEDPNVLIAIPLLNLGTVAAGDVKVTAVTLGVQQRVKPAALPLQLGSIAGGEDSVLQLAFSASGMLASGRYTLVIQGTYRVGTTTLGFMVSRVITLPLPDNTPIESQSATLDPPLTTDGTVYPPGNQTGGEVDANPEMSFPLPEGLIQDFDLVPDGPSVDPSPDPSLINVVPRVAGAPRAATADALKFVRSRTAQAPYPSGQPWDPSGISVDLPGPEGGPGPRLVFLTGNTYALLSTNGGLTFTTLDPTTIFPGTGNYGYGPPGICCDQVVQYIPSINRVVWLIQFNLDQHGYLSDGKTAAGTNKIRIATASPETIVANGGTKGWKYWDLTTEKLNLGYNWMDFPDMAYTNNYLHIGIDSVGVGFFVIRIPLAEIQAEGYIHFRWTTPRLGAVAYLGHLAQDSPDAAYWFGHVTNHSIRVFEWPDDSTSSSSVTVNVHSWTSAKSAYSTTTPWGYDWLAFNNGCGPVRGATVVQTATESGATTRTIRIAWAAGRDAAYPYPYIRMVNILRIDYPGLRMWTVSKGPKIWSTNVAYAYPYLTTNGEGEVGIALAYGGPSQHASAMAGIVGGTLHFSHRSTISLDRWGDYTTIRKHWPNTSLFSVSEYYLMPSEVCCYGPITYHQYRLFGREGSVGSTQ